MAFQFCTNDFYLYAQTGPADPGQTQVTNESESEPSDSTGEASEETPPSDIGTPEPSAPVEEQPAAPVEEQPAAPVEEQPGTPVEEQREVASTLKVEFVDANNASVKETVEQALTSKYVKDTINLDELGIDINVEGYTLTEVKDKNDNTQVYTTETKDFVLTGNVTELQFVYTQNVQTDQPEDSQEPSTPQGGQEDQNSEEDQEDTDDEDSDSQTNEGENESADSSKDDELAYPEQILSATASDGAIITIIAKEGALPEGAEVVVEPVESDSIAQIVEDALSQEEKELQTYKAYDITILLDGEEIQPKVPIQVGITGSGVTGSEKSLFHIADGSSKADKVSVIDSGSTQIFSAEGFSIYVVTGSDAESGQGGSGTILEDGATYDISKGETIVVYSNIDRGYWHSWDIQNNDDNVEWEEIEYTVDSGWGRKEYPALKITGANSGGPVTVRHTYYTGMMQQHTETCYINVLDETGRIKVNWYVNGRINKTTYVESGEIPEYGGQPTRTETSIEDPITFAGWSTEADNYSAIVTPGPAEEGQDEINYYAIFTVQTYYYFVLPGKSNESTSASDYMHAGAGTVLIPDEYRNQRWYNTQRPINSYIIQAPSDEGIRKGLATYYSDYDPNTWDYTYIYTTYSVAKPSVDYDYSTIINNGTSVHVDLSVSINTADRTTFNYHISYPDNYVNQSKLHKANETDVPIQSTVTDNDAFNTDGYTYSSTYRYNGITYYFDGWYTDSNYQLKAEDSYSGEQSRDFYAQYITQKYTLTYDYNGGVDENNQNESKYEVAAGSLTQATVVPTRRGYTFDGWTRLDNSQKVNKNGYFYMPESDLTLKANWKEDDSQWFNVTFVAGDHGSLRGKDTFNHILVDTEWSKAVTTPTPVPEKGYKFVGWQENDQEVKTFPDTVTASHTYTARFERNFDDPTYEISIEPYNDTYDGERHSVTVSGIIEGEDTVTYSLDNENFYSKEEFENNYAPVDVVSNQVIYVKVVNGTVTRTYDLEDNSYVNITKKDVAITTPSASKVYDGIALKNADSAEVSGIIDGETYGFEVTGSQLSVGSSENTYSLTLAQEGNEYTAKSINYEIRENLGTLTVYAQSIDPEDPHDPDPEDPEQPVYMGVDTNSPSNVVYDGAAHQWLPTVTAEDGTVLVLGTDYNVTYSTTDFTNVTGEIVVTITGAGNYAGEITRTYQITPRPVTLTSGSASKNYDGTALTNSEVSITSGSLVNASDVTYAADGSITNVGSTANTIEVGYANAQMDANYDVTVEEGTLTVYAQSIDPEDPHDPDPEDPEQPVYMGVDTNSPSNVVYDGAAHQWLPTVTAEDGTVLVLGTDYNVTYSTTDFTNVTGEIVVTITGAGNYAGEITRTYQITPRPVTLTSGSASKNYDGTALTNSEVSITSGSLVNASDVTYAAVGSITNVGSSLNRISVSYVSEQMARNYVVTLVEGTLTVNTAPTTPPTTPTTPPTTPGTPGTTTDDGATTDELEVEEVEDEETPLSDGDVEDVEDNATPKGNNGIWALINLIAAIVTVILGLILLLSKRHRNDEEEDEEERQARIERGEEKEQEQKRGWICKVLGVIVAIASVVFFILTEDMSLPMALTDKWTIWMIVIAIVELVLVLVGRHWKDVDDEDQEQQA